MSSICEEIDSISKQIERIQNTLFKEREFTTSTPIQHGGARPKQFGARGPSRSPDRVFVPARDSPFTQERDIVGPSSKVEKTVKFNTYSEVDTPPLPKDAGCDSTTYRTVVRQGGPNKSTDSTVNRDSNGVKIKPSKYDGNTPWIDYLSHFEMCSMVNNWSEDQKGLYLAVSLIGPAQSVLGDLPKENRRVFSDLVSALEERFAPRSQTELYRVQFKEKHQWAGESLPELGQSIRRLSNLAYLTAPLDVRDILAKEQFIDALVNSDMRLRVKQARPKVLNDAIKLAVELEAYNKAEDKVKQGKGYLRQTSNEDTYENKGKPIDVTKWMHTMEKNVQDLATEIKKLKMPVRGNQSFKRNNYNGPNNMSTNAKSVNECYSCGEQGNFSDQGRQYESKLFKGVCDILNIKKTRTTPYHPQSDGMVERFNRTLVTMLNSYVDEHQRDWDKYIPFVMMAYRSAEHETTDQTPNSLMLGREVSTPLDIIYEMPNSIKNIPENKWAWELKERLEDAHNFVRQKVAGEMRRQKRYHDLKLSYQMLEKDDQVYVYFPVRKVGCSPKLTSFWRGSYTVLDKYGDLTYKVNCGQGGKPQIIHVDRIRKKHNQCLGGEMAENLYETLKPDEEPAEYPMDDGMIEFASEEPEEPKEGRGYRQKRKPAWLADYEFE